MNTIYPSDIAFTPSVKAEQTRITLELEEFLAERNSMYLATANAAGQPYIQHRGGPRGFLRVLDEQRFGFADFAGNKAEGRELRGAG